MRGNTLNLTGGAVIALSLGLLAACSGGGKTTMPIKEQMKKVVEPTSNVLFGVGVDVDPANGPDALKVSDARWKEAADAAITLREVAATLNEKGRGKDEADWKMWVQQFSEQTDAAAKAAAAKDGAAFSTMANNLAETCGTCHKKYKPQT